MSQTIYDDLVLLFYDDSFVFIIILRAKAPSLVTYDEARNFVIESACSVTKFVSVMTKSSLMNTFLVVIPKYSGEMNPGLWLKDYWLACQAGGVDSDSFIIRNLPLFLADLA